MSLLPVCTARARSVECIKLLKEADLVVTNPPFSLFRQYIGQLIAMTKKFLVIANYNAITYKEIFALLKDIRWPSVFPSTGMWCDGFSPLGISRNQTPLGRLG